MRKLLPILTLAAALGAADLHAGAHAFVRNLGRGVNLGNILEAPSEGAWGVRLYARDFPLIKAQGFQHVRIPIRWDTRMDTAAPYTILPAFFKRVDSAVAWTRRNNLFGVINFHHHDAIFADYEKDKPRFLAAWKQVAEHYKDLPDSIGFEILNEPNSDLTAERWNELIPEALAIIRESNPRRPVVIGTAEWGGVGALRKLVIPADSLLVLTIHYYNPFPFTHQGADWVEGAENWIGATWDGNYFEKNAVQQDFAQVRAFAAEHDLPVWIGEFGALATADSASRARWTAYLARQFEAWGFAWSLWDFKAGFGIYDETMGEWNASMLAALFSDDTTVLRMPDLPEGRDICRNGSFADDSTDWDLNLPKGDATLSIEDSAARVSVTLVTPENWGVQLLQAPVLLQRGRKYALLFDAWASGARTLGAAVDANLPDFWAHGSVGGLGLTTARKSFHVAFQAAQDDSDARIVFQLGGDTTTTWIDNVVLLELDPPVDAIGPRARHSGARLVRAGNLLRTSLALPQVQLVDIRGRIVARLDWTKAPAGWEARIPTLPAGLYVARAGSTSFAIPVTE